MAATQYTSRNIVIDNVIHLPKSAAKRAADRLVLELHPYSPSTDLARFPRTPVFAEVETFSQTWRSLPSVVLDNTYSYNANLDVQRALSAKIFSEPETFVQPQRGNAIVVLQTYTTPAQHSTSTRSIVVETTVSFHGQRGSLLVLAQAPAPSIPADVFTGSDTFIGWPLETFEPPTFPQAWKSSALILNGFAPYIPAHDVQRAPQAKVFSDPEVFAQSWVTNVTILNGRAAYVAANDFRAAQAKVFPEPETFLKAWTFNPIVMQGFTPYNPGTDVRDLIPQQKWFTDPEVFAQQAIGSNVVILNVAPAPPYVPLDIGMIGIRVRPGGYIRMNIRPNQNYPL